MPSRQANATASIDKTRLLVCNDVARDQARNILIARGLRREDVRRSPAAIKRRVVFDCRSQIQTFARSKWITNPARGSQVSVQAAFQCSFEVSDGDASPTAR